MINQYIWNPLDWIHARNPTIEYTNAKITELKTHSIVRVRDDYAACMLTVCCELYTPEYIEHYHKGIYTEIVLLTDFEVIELPIWLKAVAVNSGQEVEVHPSQLVELLEEINYTHVDLWLNNETGDYIVKIINS